MSRTLSVELTEKTSRKVGALAILSGRPFSEIERDLPLIFDRLISDELANIIDTMDGGRPTVAKEGAHGSLEEVEEVVQSEGSSSAESDAGPAAAGGDGEVLFGDFSGHSLSGDLDDGADTSPQVEEPQAPQKTKAAQKKEIEMTMPRIEVDDVGGDADAYLDAALGRPGVPQSAAPKEQTRAASRAFGGKPRVTIKSYGDDE